MHILVFIDDNIWGKLQSFRLNAGRFVSPRLNQQDNVGGIERLVSEVEATANRDIWRIGH
jgi:hypothetical protein